MPKGKGTYGKKRGRPPKSQKKSSRKKTAPKRTGRSSRY